VKSFFLILVAAIAISACAPARGIEAWRLLDDINAGWGPSALKDATPTPRRDAVAYRVGDRDYTGDLYRPGDAALASLVLVPGAAEDGKDDPRLVAVAHSLARARFLVLVPEIPNLRALKVRPEDAGAVTDALRHLAAREDAPGETYGLVAISYAAGPATLAALEPEVAPSVRFLVSVGGYYDIEALVTFFTTGHYRAGPNDVWRNAQPNPYGRWVFLRSNAERLDTARDRVLLTAMAQRKLDDLNSPIDDLADRLGPEGQSVYALLINSDPDRVPHLIAALPSAIRHDMRALDLKSRDLSGLRAQAILIHGRDDRIIPFTESEALARSLNAAQVELALVDNLAHVDLVDVGLFDSVRLWDAAYRVLTLRDDIAAAQDTE
jgi:pimeloyl-ACP methyl ester carboxylesterase